MLPASAKSALWLDRLREVADELKLVRLGVAPVGPVARHEYVRDWLAQGHAGTMAYLQRHHALRMDPQQLLPGARSIIVVADSYHQEALIARTDDTPRGRVARYAWGRDYHRVLRKKLHRLADELLAMADEPVETRVCVDTAPLIEREVAALAGIGWIGKNTMVLHQEIGSYFFLGEILTTLELPLSEPVTDHCGSCTRCLDACPTEAFTAPYMMDASRCISYLTIEHREPIDADLQPLMDDWVYGCDVCQEVCPFNQKPAATPESAYRPSERFPLAPSPPLQTLIDLDEPTWDKSLRGSAMRRATYGMLQRNARIAEQNLIETQRCKGAKAQRKKR